VLTHLVGADVVLKHFVEVDVVSITFGIGDDVSC
jgi:hypothetical protein